MATSDSKKESVSVRSRIWAFGFSVCWLSGFSTLVFMWFWVFLDSQFQQTLAWLLEDVSPKVYKGYRPSIVIAEADVASRLTWMKAAIAASVIGSSGMLFGLLFGTRRFRSIAAWLGCILLVSGWVALFLSWQDVAWHGKRFRLSNDLATLEPIASQLREDWPLVDGTVPDIGYCSAYPYGEARVLLLLNPGQNEESKIVFQAVERSQQGGLRFQLVGLEHSDWLEWHPPGERPKSFQGGLEDEYTLMRTSPISNGWYLSRYQMPNSITP